MDESEKKAVLALYPEFHTIYGPYLRKDGRHVVILYDGKRRSARQLAKVRLEVSLNRRLIDDETVDHVDNNVGNDSVDNLQVLSRLHHAKADALQAPLEQCECRWCGKEFTLSKDQRNSSKAGPFCSRTCTGAYGASVQNGGNSLKRNTANRTYKRFK